MYLLKCMTFCCVFLNWIVKWVLHCGRQGARRKWRWQINREFHTGLFLFYKKMYFNCNNHWTWINGIWKKWKCHFMNQSSLWQSCFRRHVMWHAFLLNSLVKNVNVHWGTLMSRLKRMEKLDISVSTKKRVFTKYKCAEGLQTLFET